MAIATATPLGYLERPRPSGLADVIDVILKGLVIDEKDEDEDHKPKSRTRRSSSSSGSRSRSGRSSS